MTIMDSVSPNDRGQSISFRFYHRVQVVMLVCSLDDEHSLLKLPQWIDEARQHIKVYVHVTYTNYTCTGYYIK